jgi:uncharacterized repeat protein (TIGR01451 family)
MNKNMKYKNTIQNFIFISILLVMSFVYGAKAVQAQNIAVEFQSSPLFLNLDTKPGDETTRWVKVTNFTGSDRVVGVQATNTYDCTGDPFCLADVLQFTVKKGATVLYQNTLAGFFADGGVVLISQAGGSTEQYDFTVQFPAVIGNDYQTLTTHFDLLVGFVGESEGGGGITISTTGGSGSTPQPIINIQKSGDASVVQGLYGSYILTITNIGTAVANNTVVTDTLPAGFTFVNNGLATQVWNLGSLQPNEVRTIVYDMNVPVGIVGQYTNHAEVSVDSRKDGGYFSKDDFDFTIVQVKGFEAFDSTPPDSPKVLGLEAEDQGYDKLPTAGGLLLSLFGYDNDRNVIKSQTAVSQYYYLWAIGIYILVFGLLFLARKHWRKY